MVFLITDTQIKEESFLEDIDSLLNSGEVPNIFAADEKSEIMEVSVIVEKNAVNIIRWSQIFFLIIIDSLSFGTNGQIKTCNEIRIYTVCYFICIFWKH